MLASFKEIKDIIELYIQNLILLNYNLRHILPNDEHIIIIFNGNVTLKTNEIVSVGVIINYSPKKKK